MSVVGTLAKLSVALGFVVLATTTPASPQTSDVPQRTSTQPPPTSRADFIRAEADMVRAVADQTKAEAERMKAKVEEAKVDLDRLKAFDLRRQFYWDWSYRVGLLVVGLFLLLWLIPQISEISLPWGTGSISVKRAPKQPLAIETPPQPVSHPALEETLEVLRKALPESASQPLVGRREEAEVYQAAGVVKDAIYVCHHAKKIPRTELSRLRMYLDAEDPAILEKVEHVRYRLHPTFRPAEVIRSNAREQFEYEAAAWGEFMLYADVRFKGVPGSVELKRYLNF